MRIMLCALLICASAPSAAQSVATAPDTEELTVVASRLPLTTERVGRAVTILETEDIRDLGYAYAADLLRHVPGIAVSRTGGYAGFTQIRLRGAEANHSVVLIDGIDASAAGSGEFDFASLLSSDIERIEVLRGPHSGLYGSNAMAGVISIHTAAPQQGLHAAAHLETGEHDAAHYGVSLHGGNERFTGRISLNRRKSSFDLSRDDSLMGAEQDTDENRTLSGQVRLTLSEALQVSLFGRRTDRDTDTDGFAFDGGPLQGLPIDDHSFSDTKNRTWGAVTTLRLAEDRFSGRIALQRSDAEIDGGTFGSASERRQTRVDGSWHWSPDAQVTQRTTLFAQREREQFRNLFPFEPSQAPTQERDLFGYGVEHRVAFQDRLFLSGVLRRDDNDDFEDTHTWSLDAAWRVGDGRTRVHASLGEGVTNPTFFEQFGFVPGTFIGNPRLKPERSRGWDAGIAQSAFSERLHADVTYFRADLQDEIQPVFPSVDNLTGESRRSGVELSLRYLPDARTSLSASYTYTDADEPGGEEIRRPRHTASATVARELFAGRAHLAASVVHNGDMLDNDFRRFFSNGFVAQRSTLHGYTVVNVNARVAITDGIELYARIENLFDEDYEESIGYATPGRAAFAGVRLHIGR